MTNGALQEDALQQDILDNLVDIDIQNPIEQDFDEMIDLDEVIVDDTNN